MSEQEPKSFWNTLPGIITAITGLITAIGGLLVILNEVGLLNTNDNITTTIPNDTETSSTPEVRKECVTIINDPNPPINVRKKPNGEIIGTLPNGKEVIVTGNLITWLRIDYNGQDAYIFKDLTEKKC